MLKNLNSFWKIVVYDYVPTIVSAPHPLSGPGGLGHSGRDFLSWAWSLQGRAMGVWCRDLGTRKRKEGASWSWKWYICIPVSSLQSLFHETACKKKKQTSWIAITRKHYGGSTKRKLTPKWSVKKWPLQWKAVFNSCVFLLSPAPFHPQHSSLSPALHEISQQMLFCESFEFILEEGGLSWVLLWNTHIHLETQTEEVFIVGKMTRVPSEMTTNPQLRRNYVEKMGNFSLKKKKERKTWSLHYTCISLSSG